MKLYVVIEDNGYDGYGRPLSIWTTKEAAEVHAAELRAGVEFSHYGQIGINVHEYEADKPDGEIDPP